MTEDLRLAELTKWLDFALEQQSMEISVASADASFRRYFRVKTPDSKKEKTWIAMDAPPDKEDCKPFVKVATAFHHLGMNVPEIYAQDLSHGFLVLTDFGNTCYLDQLNEANADCLYGDAMQALLNLQTNDKPHNVTLPPYDKPLLDREMQLFNDWFLAKHVQLALSEDESAGLRLVYDSLIDNALTQEQVWVHRDYHCRNLMLTDNNNPGVIDFQDAVEGPITYDLVSLLRDCYISWPLEKIEVWVENYLTQLQSRNKCRDTSVKTFMRWFDLMGVQRHLKAIGIFARLNYRDGKSGYLNDIPRTLNYVQQVTAKYDELTVLNQLITSRILPAMKDVS